MKRFSELKLKPEERKGIIAFSRRLKKALGKQLVSVQLFGSKVRGDFHKESDIDMYVLVKNKSMAVHDTVAEVAAGVWDEFDVSLSPVIYTVDEQQKNLQMHSFFFEAVQREGIPL